MADQAQPRVTAEEQRLADARAGAPWRLWGPYLSERQWGTVREDYSADGNAWGVLQPRPGALPRLSLGRGRPRGRQRRQAAPVPRARPVERHDPILKERLFGLTNARATTARTSRSTTSTSTTCRRTATSAGCYKYPHAAYPYDDLVRTQPRAAARTELEYELVDTGVFDDDRYFDVEVEYAKAAPDDLLCRITVHNRGPESAALHVLPTLWFRNTWSWTADQPRPRLSTRRGVTSRSCAPSTPTSASCGCTAGVAGDAAVQPRTRPTARAIRSRRPNASPTPRTASTSTSCTARDAVNPALEGTKAAVARATRRPRRRVRVGARPRSTPEATGRPDRAVRRRRAS